MTDALLDVEGLVVETRGSARAPAGRRLVQGISFKVGREKVAIVGESGSGKSLKIGRAHV